MELLRSFESDTGFERADFSCGQGLIGTKAKRYNKRFKQVFGYTRKDLDFSEPKLCAEQVSKCYKQLFGEVVTKKRPRIDGKQVTTYSLKGLELHQKLMRQRSNVSTFDGCMIDL
eukprot:m.184821 g.184821  ORF g.184821 m.184821 type:complete len:115 (-) comp24710_c0_seq3:893-1237(-)